jgi:23S rRNA (uracil1939-C5)-methyltransferase
VEKKVIGKCIDYTYDGKGIVKKDNKVIFVDGIIKDEEVEIEIIHESKNQTLGRLVKIIKSSPYRVKPFCPLAKDCGGCVLQHLNYDKQLEFKTNHVQDCIRKFSKIDVPVEKCIGMENPFNYRNKSQVPFSMERKQICYGFYKQNTHKIIQMNSCAIQTEDADKILATIKDLMKKHRISPYEEDKRKGVLRHVLIKKGFYTNQVMVVLITNVNSFPNRKEIVKDLIKIHPNIKTIVQNINTRDTNVILGEKENILYGSGYIEDVMLGVKFKISSKSFYQVNPMQTETLYSKAIELANLSKKDRILDTYCGIGTIGLIASKKVDEVVGVEIVKDAIKDAKANAALNNINNANFVLADASDFMVDLAKTSEKMDVVFVDPPRKGCDEKFLSSLMKLSPNKIVYISCNPSTLARDLGILKEKYDIRKIQPVDMFPHTYHVETIALLHKKNIYN